MRPSMSASVGFSLLASGMVILTGLTDRPLPDRLALVAVEVLMWTAGFLFAVAIRKTNREL